jgi:DAACS family dicarboxylate/amino acid:cation (Na+ or H+) symporter
MGAHVSPPHSSANPSPGFWGFYERTPLYVRIVVALLFGIAVGKIWGPDAQMLKPISDIVLKLLGALATPLIFCALMNALLSTQVTGRAFVRMLVLLTINTVVAILVGLAVANVVQPGRWVQSDDADIQADLKQKVASAAKTKTEKPLEALAEKVPGSILMALANNDILAVIAVALAFGIALRIVRRQQEGQPEQPYRAVEHFVDTIFRCVMIMLHWIFHLVPLAVFAVVARLVGEKGFHPFVQLGGFVVAVIVALTIQAGYYLLRLRWSSWVRPSEFLRGASDALAMAFSTASSAATLPVTFDCMVKNIGVREENASMGVMVGGTFNHDGTALYEAMAALFISQILGQHLGFSAQLVVVVMAVFASVGAAGIPEAGLVTMVAVFKAVDLPPDMIPLLLTVDWFLDRCRTAINVMGDMSVTCILDGKTRPAPADVAEPAADAIMSID